MVHGSNKVENHYCRLYIFWKGTSVFLSSSSANVTDHVNKAASKLRHLGFVQIKQNYRGKTIVTCACQSVRRILHHVFTYVYVYLFSVEFLQLFAEESSFFL